MQGALLPQGRTWIHASGDFANWPDFAPGFAEPVKITYSVNSSCYCLTFPSNQDNTFKSCVLCVFRMRPFNRLNHYPKIITTVSGRAIVEWLNHRSYFKKKTRLRKFILQKSLRRENILFKNVFASKQTLAKHVLNWLKLEAGGG